MRLEIERMWKETVPIQDPTAAIFMNYELSWVTLLFVTNIDSARKDV